MSSRFVIAGGGEFGCHYLEKLESARASRRDLVSEVVVVDRDPDCPAAAAVRTRSWARIIVADWMSFGRTVWHDQDAWTDSIWVPAPIAPHIFSDWLVDWLAEADYSAQVLPDRVPLPALPFAQQLPDGRVLLSHAPGTCPLGCIEPAACAITLAPRWWEMGDTVDAFCRTIGLRSDALGRMFCKHHCDADALEVGGLAFAAIFAEASRLIGLAAAGKKRLGIATFSSCHAVVSLLEVSLNHPGRRTTPARPVG